LKPVWTAKQNLGSKDREEGRRENDLQHEGHSNFLGKCGLKRYAYMIKAMNKVDI
jgi:hypothetical protein